MRLIVLDTNCLIQILPTRSRYHVIWNDFLYGDCHLCVSNEILAEYEEILSIHTSPQVARNVVEVIAHHPNTEYRESYFHFRLLAHIDKDDDKFVDCAITANAEYIVSDDKHFSLLKSVSFPRLNVLTLDEYYEIIENKTTDNNN